MLITRPVVKAYNVTLHTSSLGDILQVLRRNKAPNTRKQLLRIHDIELRKYWDATASSGGIMNAHEPVYLVCQNAKVGSDFVRQYLNERRMILANMKYALALFAEHPHILSTEPAGYGEQALSEDPLLEPGKPIVVLGAAIKDAVPIVTGGASGASLTEGRIGGEWQEGARFLAISNPRYS